MRDPRGGHISGDVPVEHLPRVSDRPGLGTPSGRPTWPEIQVVATVAAEPHMHIQFGLQRALPVLGYAVWSDGQMTPMFHWPAHGQIRAVSPRERGWALRIIPPQNGPLTVDEPQEDGAEHDF